MRKTLAITLFAAIVAVSNGCGFSGDDETSASSDEDLGSAFSPDHGALVGLSGKCLNVKGGSKASGTPVILYDCVGLANEEWTRPDSHGRIRGLGGKCLAAKNGAVVLASCNGSAGQRWAIQESHVVGLGGKCLAVQGANPANGTSVVLGDCTEADDVSWTYRPDLTLTIQPVLVYDSDGKRGPDTDPKAPFTFDVVLQQVKDANAVYAPSHIQFRSASPVAVYNTAINNLTSYEEGGQAAFYAAQYPNRIVVFYRWGSPPPAGRNGGGFSSPPWGSDGWNFVAMPSTTHSSADLAHETGHYLGLDHTFVYDESDETLTLKEDLQALQDNYDVSALDGDGLSDTPPDPGAGLWKYYGWDGCDPAHPSVDVDGLIFKPDRNNVMSYFGCKPEHFTPMQRAKHRAALAAPLRQMIGADVFVPGPQRIFGQAGKCLRPDADPDNAGLLVLSSCTGDGAEWWTFAGDGTLVVGDQCLHAGPDANMTRPQLGDCDGAADTVWTRETDGELVAAGGRCLNVAGGSTDDGAPVVLWTCTPSARNEKWFSAYPVPPPARPQN